LAVIRGNVSKDLSILTYDDFYTMVRRDFDYHKNLRKGSGERPGPTFEFSNANERDNFIRYLMTDFARFCLSIYKIGSNLYYGEMSMIPWLDFSESWDDEKLFQYFHINENTQKYIRDFLSDYYGFR
jgi:hypothetical protein